MRNADTFSQITCSDMAQFVDAELVQELSYEAQQTVSQHLKICQNCNDFFRLSGNLRHFPGELSKEELDFAVHRVMTKARREEQTSARRRFGLPSIAVAASIAAAVVVGGYFWLAGPADHAMPGDFACTATTPTQPVAGVYLSYCDGYRAPEIKVKPDGELRVSLLQGAVGLRVNPMRPNKRDVIVETASGEVRVKGTVFTVRAAEETSWVEVFRGTVEVAPHGSGVAPYRVSEGKGAAVDNGKRFALTAPRTEMLRDKLRVSTADVVDVESGGPAATAVGAAEVVSTDSADVEAEPAVSERHRSRSQHAKGADTMFSLIQKAQSCLIERDWACAASQYRTVLARYPRRPEAAAVRISLAKVELRYLNAPADALRHYKLYQTHTPNGPLSEEAQFGIAEALQRLGRTDEAKAALRHFIAQFPDSSLVRKARTRLARLEK